MKKKTTKTRTKKKTPRTVTVAEEFYSVRWQADIERRLRALEARPAVVLPVETSTPTWQVPRPASPGTVMPWPPPVPFFTGNT